MHTIAVVERCKWRKASETQLLLMVQKALFSHSSIIDKLKKLRVL